MAVSMQTYNDYIRPFYSRFETVKGNSPADFSKAAFLAFVAEFPEFTNNSANTDFLQYCFEQYFGQG